VQVGRIHRFHAPILLLALALLAGASTGRAGDLAISLYSGQVTDGNWGKALSRHVRFVDAYLLASAVSWTASRHADGALCLELEGQVAKYFHVQRHWEFNLPLVGIRWSRFPWQEHLATSVAWGVGPSYATEVPVVERMTHPTSEQWLVYWYAELLCGSPHSDWGVILRLHHRSTAFGLVAETGGSNTWAAGLKFRI
jgi:hypothetical protein